MLRPERKQKACDGDVTDDLLQRARSVHRMTFIPTSPEDKGSECSQLGFRKSFCGRTVVWLWRSFFAFGLVYMTLLVLDQYGAIPMDFVNAYYFTTKTGRGVFFVIFVLVCTTFLLYALLGDDGVVLFLKPCPLIDATFVLVKENTPAEHLEDDLNNEEEADESNSKKNGFFVKIKRKFTKSKNDQVKSTLIEVKQFISQQQSSKLIRYFEFTCVRYIWNDAGQRFKPHRPKPVTGNEALSAVSNGGLSSGEVEEKHAYCGSNQIDVPVPTVFKALKDEFSTPVSVIQLGSPWVYFKENLWNVAILWMVMIIGSGCYRAILIVRKGFLEIQKLAQNHSRCKVLRDKKWSTREVSDLVPGDVVDLETGSAPCDGVVISGGVVVNESMLTGWKDKICVFG